MTIRFPKSPLGAFALALGLGAGFMGAGLLAMRLPVGVLPMPEPDLADVPDQRPELRYIALRDALVASHPALPGTVELELGVSVTPRDEDRVRTVLRDEFAPVQAMLTDALVALIARSGVDHGDWSELRAPLSALMLDEINDCFERLGEGRPVQEVYVTDFVAR